MLMNPDAKAPLMHPEETPVIRMAIRAKESLGGGGSFGDKPKRKSSGGGSFGYGDKPKRKSSGGAS